MADLNLSPDAVDDVVFQLSPFLLVTLLLVDLSLGKTVPICPDLFWR